MIDPRPLAEAQVLGVAKSTLDATALAVTARAGISESFGAQSAIACCHRREKPVPLFVQNRHCTRILSAFPASCKR